MFSIFDDSNDWCFSRSRVCLVEIDSNTSSGRNRIFPTPIFYVSGSCLKDETRCLDSFSFDFFDSCCLACLHLVIDKQITTHYNNPWLTLMLALFHRRVEMSMHQHLAPLGKAQLIPLFIWNLGI